MKFLVVGWDEDEQQAFWDVIPVNVESEEAGKERAVERFGELRGEYADVVDVLTVEELVRMAKRIADSDEADDERAYRELEDEAGVTREEEEGEAAG